MTGTAATMGIEENLALAKRRGKTRFLRSGITKAEREEYKELLKILNLGLEDRLTYKVGLLTTLMITHNMKDAIAHGNSLMMMMNGKIILDIQGEEKKKLTVKQLLDKFEEASGEEFSNDSAILG